VKRAPLGLAIAAISSRTGPSPRSASASVIAPIAVVDCRRAGTRASGRVTVTSAPVSS
jgi:hypothetical protein